MKKPAALIVTLLIIAILAVLPVNEALTTEPQDNPTRGDGVTIYSPSNRTYDPNEVIIINATSGSIAGQNVIYSGTATVDGKLYSLQMESRQRESWDLFFGTLIGSATLPKLSEGQHEITVHMKTFISPSTDPTIEGEATVYFTIGDRTPPNITLTSIRNETYNQTSIPLNFSINEPTSWIMYSLDGDANISLAANTTLTAATGSHAIVLYANDTAGNMGQSKVVHFTVQMPEGSSKLQTGDIAILVVIVLASSAAIAAILLNYRKNRKGLDR